MDILAGAVEREPDRLAIVCNDESYTYGKLQQATELFANDLIKMGLQPGDHVALWSVNHICWPIAYLGIIRAGGVAVLLNYALPAEDILAQMRNTDVKFIAYGKNRETEADSLAAEKMAAQLGIPFAHICDIRQDFHGRINNGEKANELPPLNRDSKRTATIIFSTGTTGAPKGVQQSQLAMCNNIICFYERLKDVSEKKKLIAIPLFHSYGLEVMFYNFMKLSSIWLVDNFKPDHLLEIIHENQIDSFNTATVTCRGIINHPRFTPEIANRFTFTGIGGSQASPEEMKAINDAFPNAQMLQGYGQTEACTFITTFFPGDSIEKMTTTEGKVLPCHEVKIIDSKGNRLRNGESVEACIMPDAETWNGEEELMQKLSGKLNSFMMPSHFFIYDQFPLTENGKIDQRVLKEDVIGKLAKMTR